MTLLRAYTWPGNIRELENTIERAVALSNQAMLTPEDLPVEMHDRSTPEANPDRPSVRESGSSSSVREFPRQTPATRESKNARCRAQMRRLFRGGGDPLVLRLKI